MKAIHHDLKYKTLSQNEAIDVLRIVRSGAWWYALLVVFFFFFFFLFLCGMHH